MRSHRFCVFSFVFDADQAVAVFLFSGRTNSDADFDAYLRCIAELDVIAASLDRPVLVQLIDPDNALPDARWRRRMAEATQTVRSKPFYVLVTDSAAVRGVLTAINWIRPPPFELEVVPTLDAAAQTAEARTGREVAKTIHRLALEVRRAPHKSLAPPSVRRPTGPPSSRR